MSAAALPNGSKARRPQPLTVEERARRAVAVTVAEATKPRGQNGFAVERPAAHGAVLFAALTEHVQGAGPVVPAPPISAAAHDEPIPPPVVTITIVGPPRSGKSVIAHLISGALGREGIACNGPEGLRSIDRRKATASLIYRGLTVELIKVEPAAEGAAP